MTANIDRNSFVERIAQTHNSTFAIGGFRAPQTVLYSVSSSVPADSFRFRYRQLLIDTNRWEKSTFRTIFPTNRSATPTVGKPSLLAHDVLPTVAFDAFRRGVKNSFRNDDKAERFVITYPKTEMTA